MQLLEPGKNATVLINEYLNSMYDFRYRKLAMQLLEPGKSTTVLINIILLKQHVWLQVQKASTCAASVTIPLEQVQLQGSDQVY